MTDTTKTKKKKEAATEVHKISFDGLMNEAAQDLVTGVSRVTRWREERAGRFPKRVQISPGRVGRHGHEIKAWIDSRPRVNGET